MYSNLFFTKEKGKAVCANFLKASVFFSMLMILSQLSMAQMTIIIDDPVGKWENLDSPEIQVFPNPTTDQITVSPPVGEPITYFEIFGSCGQLLLEFTVTGSMTLSTSLSPRTYHFRITTDSGVYYKTVVLL